MKVTVIIPTHSKTEAYLRKTMESLRAAKVSQHWDIIVVSNGGPWYPLNDLQATRRLHITEQGQCIAVNYGAQMVSADTTHIMVTNDDMYYAPNWGDNLIEPDDQNKLMVDYRVFSPNLIEPVEIGSAPPFLKLDGGTDLETFRQEFVDKFVQDNVDPRRGTQEGDEDTTGFNLPFFCDVEVWRTIGGYDAAYDPWGSNSDTDLQTLFEIAGIQPMRLRDVLVYHFGSKSESFTPEKQGFWQKNWDYYTNKFGFNRDMEPKADTWMAKGMVIPALLKFHPKWEGKYRD